MNRDSLKLLIIYTLMKSHIALTVNKKSLTRGDTTLRCGFYVFNYFNLLI